MKLNSKKILVFLVWTILALVGMNSLPEGMYHEENPYSRQDWLK